MFRELPDDLVRSVEYLTIADHARAGQTGAAKNAWMSFERAAIWLESQHLIPAPLSLGVSGRKGPSAHTARIKSVARLLRFPERSLRALYENGEADAYGNSALGAARRALTQREIDDAVETARAVLQQLGPFLPNKVQRELLATRLVATTMPTPEDHLLELVEHATMYGEYGGLADGKLDVLSHPVRAPMNAREQEVAGTIALLCAHRALHLRHFGGPSGVFAWASRSLELYKGIHNPYRVHHLWYLKAVAHRRLGRLERAKWALGQGYDAAGGDRALLNRIKVQDACLSLAAGAFSAAVMTARAAYEEAAVAAWAGSRVLGGREIILGIVLAVDKQPDEGEKFLQRALARPERRDPISKCSGQLGLVYVAHARGNLDEARRRAIRLCHLARGHRLLWHAGRAEAVFSRRRSDGVPI